MDSFRTNRESPSTRNANRSIYSYDIHDTVKRRPVFSTVIMCAFRSSLKILERRSVGKPDALRRAVSAVAVSIRSVARRGGRPSVCMLWFRWDIRLAARLARNKR